MAVLFLTKRAYLRGTCSEVVVCHVGCLTPLSCRHVSSYVYVGPIIRPEEFTDIWSDVSFAMEFCVNMPL